MSPLPHKVLSEFKDFGHTVSVGSVWTPPNEDTAVRLVKAGCLRAATEGDLKKAEKAAAAATAAAESDAGDGESAGGVETESSPPEPKPAKPRRGRRGKRK